MNSRTASFITALWNTLETRGVRAAVPRNFEGLPGSLRGDLDVWVLPSDVEAVRAAVLTAASGAGLRLMFEEEVWNHHHLTLWWPEEDAAGARPQGIHLDLQTALGKKGFLYAPVEPFLDSVLPLNGVTVPPPAARAVGLALHALLDRGCVRESDRRALERDAGEGLELFATTVLPADPARKIVRWVLAGAPEEEVDGLASCLKRALRRRHPLNRVRPLCVRLRRWSRYLGRRRGALVALVGPDGAGKSTLSEAMLRMMPPGPYPVRSVYMGKRDPFLPTSRLIRVLSQRGAASQADASPRESAARPRKMLKRLKDAAGLINWVIDQWARYLIRVRPLLQQGGIVLADRYSFDFAQRDSSSIAHHPFLRKVLCRCFPAPDRTYLLWEDPEILWKRKGEGTPRTMAEILARFRLILGSIPRAREVRTNGPAETVAGVMATEVARLLEARCRP